MGQPIQFNEELTKTTFLTPEEESDLPELYQEESRVDYFSFLLENDLGFGNVNFERYYHFIKNGNALYVRVHNEERNYKYRWDGFPKQSDTYIYKFIIDPSRENPFVLTKQTKID